MSTDIKYLIMAELLGIHAAAIEKAEEQANRIIEMVRYEEGLCTKPADIGLVVFQKATADKILDNLNESAPESLEVQSRPKHHPVPTEESKAITDRIIHLRPTGMKWREIAADVGINKEAARKRYREHQRKQKEFCSIPKDDPKNNIEQIYEPGAEEARQEADAAAATIRNALAGEDPIGKFVRGMIRKDPHAMDSEILQAAKRKFPGVSMTADDIRSGRRVT